MTVRELEARFEGKCIVCRNKINVGDNIIYAPAIRYTAHKECAAYLPPKEYLLGLAGHEGAVLDAALQLKCLLDDERQILHEKRDALLRAIERLSSESEISDDEARRFIYRINGYADQARGFLERHRGHVGKPDFYPKCHDQKI